MFFIILVLIHLFYNAIQDAFKMFSKFGDPKSDGKQITLSQSDKWMKQAKVIDGKKITTTDTAIHFKKLKSVKLGIDDYQKFLEDLAKNKKMEVEEIKRKLTTCGQPGVSTHVCNISGYCFQSRAITMTLSLYIVIIVYS